MSKPKFVYVTYIASTPEKVFEALTSEKLTAQYWFGYALRSDWKVGSLCCGNLRVYALTAVFPVVFPDRFADESLPDYAA